MEYLLHKEKEFWNCVQTRKVPNLILPEIWKEIIMEFNLSTDIKQSIPNAIVFNFEELKAELSEKIKHLETLAVTEDDLKSAKSDKATLNKLKRL